MTSKLAIAFTLLLAIASFPASANDQAISETSRDVAVQLDKADTNDSVSIHSDGTVPTPAPTEGLLGSDKPLLLPEWTAAQVKGEILSCDIVDGTPCVDSCPSCLVVGHLSCPDPSPCFCSRGYCQCDVGPGDF